MVVVILACRHKKEHLSRIETALKWVLKNDICPIFVFTGKDPVPPNRISVLFSDRRKIWEEESIDTEESVINTLKVLKNNWISDLPRAWVISWYHPPKIKLFLRRAGIDEKRETFVRSYSGIHLINVLVEPFALLAALFRINHWPVITSVKRLLGYNV